MAEPAVDTARLEKNRANEEREAIIAFLTSLNVSSRTELMAKLEARMKQTWENIEISRNLGLI